MNFIIFIWKEPDTEIFICLKGRCIEAKNLPCVNFYIQLKRKDMENWLNGKIVAGLRFFKNKKSLFKFNESTTYILQKCLETFTLPQNHFQISITLKYGYCKKLHLNKWTSDQLNTFLITLWYLPLVLLGSFVEVTSY